MTALLALLYLALVGIGLRADALQIPGAAAVLGVAVTIWLDGRAVRVPWGVWRGSLPVILATPGILVASLASLAGAISLAVPWKQRIAWLAFAQALILGRTYIPYYPGVFLAAVVFLAERSRSAQIPKDDLQTRRLRFAMLPNDLGLAAAVPVLMACRPDWLMPLGAVFLWSLMEGVSNAEFRIHAGRATQAIDRLHHQQVALEETRQRLEERDVAVERLHKQQVLLEGFSRHLARGPSLPEALKSVLETVRAVMSCRSVVVFLSQGDRLAPAAIMSPEKEALEGSLLTAQSHPLVEQAFAWERASVWQGTSNHGGLLSREVYAVACPLEKLGVLYVGREHGMITAEEAQMLSWVSQKASLALGVALRQQSTSEILKEKTAQNYALRERLQLLAKLVEGSVSLASQLSMESLLDTLHWELENTLPHDAGTLYLVRNENLQLERYWPPDRKDNFNNLAAVAAVVAENRTPLLFPDIRETRFSFEPNTPRSLIAAPILHHDQLMGVLLLQAIPWNSFDREHMHVLTLLALQLAVFLSNAELYQQVVEARHKLEVSQAQLIQSSKLTAIGQLAAGVAHELNTPLGAISLSLEMLEMAGATGKPMQNAQSALERAQKIVNKLLIYARKESDEGGTEWVKVQDVAEAACELVKSRFRMRAVELHWAEARGWEVQARSSELQQVLVNLLINAADAYTDQTDRRVFVRAVEFEEGCAIEIEDYAGGIALDVQDRIFDPFFTTKPVGEGTGLGLSISQEIVLQFKAELEFQTAPGQGTIFRVKFPKGLARRTTSMVF